MIGTPQGWEFGEAVVQTPGGHYFVGGLDDTSDYSLRKADQPSNEKWNKTYRRTDQERFGTMRLMLDNGVFMRGASWEMMEALDI